MTEELEKCVKDFSYFCETYLQIANYNRELVPFKLFDYQKRLVDFYSENQFSLVPHFRKGGFSETTLAYLLWKCLFTLDFQVMTLCKTDREAIWHGDIIKKHLDRLPDWLSPKMVKNNDHMKMFEETNSCMHFYTPQAACGKRVDYLYVDEAAFIPDMKQHWKAMWPTLSCGGKCMMVSGVNGTWFDSTVREARQSKNQFKVFDNKFTENPVFNNVDWVVERVNMLGLIGWNMEYMQEMPPEDKRIHCPIWGLFQKTGEKC